MKKRNRMKLINLLLTISLILVVVSGSLLHGMGASMALGITHGLSGYAFAIFAVIHLLQHRKRS